MNIFFDLFEMDTTGKQVSGAETDSLKSEVPNHREDTSQGSEFLDDVIWETDQSLLTGSQQDLHSDEDQ